MLISCSVLFSGFAGCCRRSVPAYGDQPYSKAAAAVGCCCLGRNSTVKTEHVPVCDICLACMHFHSAAQSVLVQRVLTMFDCCWLQVGEVEANPHGQICWYMPNTRQQFRISGQLQLVGAAASDAHLAAARQSAWCKLSDPGEGRGERARACCRCMCKRPAVYRAGGEGVGLGVLEGRGGW
jgi:hypothetical protein